MKKRILFLLTFLVNFPAISQTSSKRLHPTGPKFMAEQDMSGQDWLRLVLQFAHKEKFKGEKCGLIC